MADPFAQFGGALYGVNAPVPFSGVGGIFTPHWAQLDITNVFATTATRLYYVPYYFPSIGFTYTGLKSYNTGTGDSGDKFRLGVYTANLATGMPQSLVIDAGEATLSGSAAEITLAAAFAAPLKGWAWLCLHSRDSLAIAPLSTRWAVTGVGNVTPNLAMGMFGLAAIADGTASATPPGAQFGAVYVDTTYGALASTAVAPTAISPRGPTVAPYKT